MARPSGAQLRDRVLIQLTGTDLDTKLGYAIEAADAAMARYCLFPDYAAGLASLDKDVVSAAGGYTQYYDTPSRDPRRLVLGIRPVVSVTSVASDTSGDWTYATTLTANTDYVLDAIGGVLHQHPLATNAFVTGSRAMKVVFVAGFDIDNNEMLMQAIGLTINHWWTHRKPQVQSLSQGNQSITLSDPSALPPMVRDMLSPFALWEQQGRYTP